MFDIGWTELLLIGIVALIVVGPKELPGMFRKMGQFTGKARAMARDFQRAMDSAADEAGVKDLQRDFRKASSIKSLGMDEVENSIKSGLGAADFTKDWQGNPLDPGAADAAATDQAPAKEATAKEAPAKKAQPASAARDRQTPKSTSAAAGTVKTASKAAAGTRTPAAKPAAKLAAKPAGKSTAKPAAGSRAKTKGKPA